MPRLLRRQPRALFFLLCTAFRLGLDALVREPGALGRGVAGLRMRDRGRQSNFIYGSAKGGLTVYLQGLRNAMHRHKVSVLTVKPGFVDTQLLANAGKTMWVISPEEAARQIVAAIGEGRQEVYVPMRWRLVSLIIRSIPSFLFRRLNL